MTKQNIQRAAKAIEVRYLSQGGKPELFAQFMGAIYELFDFFPGEFSRPSQIFSKIFNDRYKGIKPRFDIREVVGKRESDAGLTYSFLDKKWK